MQKPKETTLDWVRHHATTISVAFLVLGTSIAAVLFTFITPHSERRAMSAAVAVLCVALLAFYAWARTPLKRPESPVAGVPGLTIREHFKRTNALFVRIMVPITGAWVVAITLFGTGMTKAHQQAWSIGGGVVLALIGSLFIRKQLRCPRCGSDFRKERFAKLGRWSFDSRGSADLWDACPHCGVSFDELYPR
jgi:drug/metabolite transporter superfamily protein YnfA